MLYEIGDPSSYILPDVVCDFSNVQFEQVEGKVLYVTYYHYVEKYFSVAYILSGYFVSKSGS